MQPIEEPIHSVLRRFGLFLPNTNRIYKGFWPLADIFNFVRIESTCYLCACIIYQPHGKVLKPKIEKSKYSTHTHCM